MKKQIIFIVFLITIMLTLMTSVSAENNTDIQINVNYEYSTDNINPEINILESNNIINFQKTKIDNNSYLLNFNTTNDKNYSLIVKAPGYNSVIKNLNISSLNNTLQINLIAEDSYKLGYEITKKADNLLNFSNANDVLVITTAGMTRINNKTTENALEGILNAGNGYISYGKGNILTLSAIRTDPTNFAYIVKNGNKLTMAFFKNGSLNPIYVGNAGPEISADEWKKLQKLLGSEDAYSYISISNAWSAGIPKDILTQATYHGHVCTGLISGQAMIQTLLKYYPPRGESGLPLENTAYYVLGVPGDSDDDAFTWTMDITPGKRAYIGIDTMVNKSMTGFIRWNSSSKTGILIIMSYDENKIKQEFKSLTGLNPDSSATNDLKYQNWLIAKLQNDPTSLVTILYEFNELSENNLYYLMGEEVGKGNVVQSAHGLDIDYILSLNLTKASRDTTNNISDNKLSSNTLKKIGIDASNMAINHFKSIGINIEKDYSKLYILTSAGYVRVNGTSTEMIYDGLRETLGSTLSRKTLLPVHTALWKDLVFDFFWVDEHNNKNTSSYSLLYNPATGKLEVTGNTSENSNYIIQQVLVYEPPYDALIAWLFHNHVCGGSSPGYLISDYIFNELPITNENESYIYITTNDNCKDDVISRLLGVSPGMENYYNLRYDNSITNSSQVGIVVKWNSKTKTGELMIIDWKAPKFKAGSDSYEEYIKLYKGDYNSPNLVSAPLLTATARKEINEEMLQNIVSGAKSTNEGNSIAYIKNLADKLPIKDNNQQSNGTTLVNNVESQPITGSSSSKVQSVGSNNAKLSSTVGLDSSSAMDNSESGEDASEGKSYEVSKKSAATKKSDNNIALAIALVFVVAIICGAGFVNYRSKN